MTKGSRKNKLAFWRERRAGRCKAPRRRRCSDIVEDAEQARDALRRAAAPMHADYYSLMIKLRLRSGTAAKCRVILARALRIFFNIFPAESVWRAHRNRDIYPND